MDELLRLRVKRQTRWRDIPIAKRRASVEISTSNKRCTGDYLIAQLEWARDQFTGFQFAIGDTLQIHNYVVFGHSSGLGPIDEGVARKQCLAEGDEWIKANGASIARILRGKPVRFVRWDEFLARPEVQANLAHLDDLNDTDEVIHRLVRQDVTGYVTRRHGAIELTEAQQRRLDRHVLEELAVYQHQAAGENLVSIYPGANQLLLRPMYLNATALPDELKRRHYITLDISPVRVGDLVGAGV